MIMSRLQSAGLLVDEFSKKFSLINTSQEKGDINSADFPDIPFYYFFPLASVRILKQRT